MDITKTPQVPFPTTDSPSLAKAQSRTLLRNAVKFEREKQKEQQTPPRDQQEFKHEQEFISYDHDANLTKQEDEPLKRSPVDILA